MAGILIAVVALIVYGSLYPWTFRVPEGVGNPFLVLAVAWDAGFDRRFIADVVINLALYVPLGMSGYLAFRRWRPGWLRVAGPVLLGAAVSVCVEMAQIYAPGRRCSAIDVMDNVAGSALGVIGGIFFETVAGRELAVGKRRAVDRSALMLLLCWVASRLFPLFPVLWLSMYRQKLAVLLSGPEFGVVAFVSAAASWYVAGLMMRKIAPGPGWLWASVALIPAQFFIVTRQPGLGELAGAVVGVLLLVVLGARPVGWVFVGVLLFRGLSPFRLGEPHGFWWIPFGGFLEMDWQPGIRVLLEKAWYFGAAIWVLRAERKRLSAAIAMVAGVAALIEIVQIYLPGRTAEVTDPLLVLLMGLAIRSVRNGAHLKTVSGSR